MNKYKMISICSLTIVCVLLLSILMPNKTDANDKESIELSMHYGNSQVKANIVVNSDIYTGIVCKYLMVDNIYQTEDLLAQTKDTGITINLDKSESNKYEAIIPNVTKRYVVIYVSIGKCSLCDYIDCKIGQKEDNKEENKQEKPAEPSKEEDKQEKPAEPSKEEDKQEKPAEPNKEENKQEKPAEPSKEENKEEKPAEPSKEENKQEKPAEPSKEENKQEKPTEPSKEQNKEDNKLIVDNKTETSKDFETIEDVTSNKNTDKDSVKTNNKNTNSNGTLAPVDKDSINVSDFQEIDKTVATSTADGKMPKTGENDFIKIFGIVVFSIISAYSFYKYKTEK